jgi:DNA-binding PadR family transcriptional regulator
LSSELSSTSYVVLGMIDWLGEPTAYEIKQRIEQSVTNFWPVPRSQVYAEATRLADAGLLAVEQEETGRRRRRYSLTDAGRHALASWRADIDTTPPEIRDPGLLKLFFGADLTALATARAAYHRAHEEELHDYLPLVEGTVGPRLSLEAGILLHQGLAEFWERLLDTPPG